MQKTATLFFTRTGLEPNGIAKWFRALVRAQVTVLRLDSGPALLKQSLCAFSCVCVQNLEQKANFYKKRVFFDNILFLFFECPAVKFNFFLKSHSKALTVCFRMCSVKSARGYQDFALERF